jgi:hypothetical protein
MDSAKRREVEQELSDHIDDCAAAYRETGITEEEAYTKAMIDMGNVLDVSEKLGSIHSFYPALHFRHAMTKICIGMVLSVIHFNFWYFAQIQELLSMILIFWGLSQIKNSSSWFRVSWITYGLLMASTSITKGLTVFSIPYTNMLLGTILYFIFYYSFSRGVGDICEEAYEKIQKVPICYCAVLIMSLLSLIGLEGWMIIPAVIAYTILVVSFFQARHIMWMSDAETNIRPMSKRHMVGMVLFMALYVLIPVIVAYGYSSYRPSSEEYVMEDVGTDSETLERVEKVRNKLLELEFPAEILQIMSQQEILRYENVEQCHLYYTSSQLPAKTISVYAQMEDDTGRFIQYYHWNDTSKGGLRARISHYFLGQMLLENTDEQDLNVVLLNGDRNYKPLQVYNTNNVIGVEYHVDRNVPNQRGFIAVDMYYFPHDQFNSSYRFTLQKDFFITDSAYEFFQEHATSGGTVYNYINPRINGWYMDGMILYWSGLTE